MKNILGLDLGTNSIGWSVVSADIHPDGSEQLTGIKSAGSRIIPMDAAALGDFERGNLKSQTAERTRLRGVRRLLERHLLRRERLHRVLRILNFLPEHYSALIDRYGKFIGEAEPKLAWRKDETGRYQFLFQDSFQEMLSEFRGVHPDLLEAGKKVPYDWTLYYLRKKALTQAVGKEELAWILLNFNKKRGYYQLRDEQEEEVKNKLVEYHALKVVNVEDSGDKKGKDIWYNVELENGWIYRRSSKEPLYEWVGQIKEFIVTTDLNDDGTPKKDKEGKVKRSFRAPGENDWTLLKKKTESDIEHSSKQIGEYIYDTLLADPHQKIRGRLIATIDRKYYKEELIKILDAQKEFHPELRDRALYQDCIEALYPNNEGHRYNIAKGDFTYLFCKDILFYQRPLKSKKSLIADCPYEQRCYVDKKSGEVVRSGIKCIPKSHPLFQEFRLWQFLSNLRIYQREKMVNGRLQVDVDVTADFLRDESDYESLFEWMNQQKQLTQDSLMRYKKFGLDRKSQKEYRWNYVEDKAYPGNETHAQIASYLKKSGLAEDVLQQKSTAETDLEEALWHILYSISDKQELIKALQKFAEQNELGDSFVEEFQKIPTFEKDYGGYSAKALRKLLPLMRMGKYWQQSAIAPDTLERIEKMLNAECDDRINDRVREKVQHFTDVSNFRGLPLWLACYVVYNRHSEAKDITRWESPEDIDAYLQAFKQHSLHNPIVEQIVTETLRTVRDIWKKEGHLDEIHVELGRDMKNPKAKRVQLAQRATDNENANLRIKALLLEFKNPEFEIEGVRPFSPSQQEILRIYEDTVLHSSDIPEEVEAILKKFNEHDTSKRPTRSEVMRYKLWLEQKYRSPYTGEVIPLGKLFTPAYEIEHVIPQKRYFDDSLSNKVICESAVNKRKDCLLGYEFIKTNGGEKIEIGHGKVVEVFSVGAYEEFVKEHYRSNPGKMRKLLMEDIPTDFIQRQLNDSRYISKLVKMLLSNIVREADEQEETSKHVISCNGSITDRLKHDWGVNDMWNRLVLPRFERLDKMCGQQRYTALNTEGKLIPSMPLELQKGFNKKRIDHRHHAMDAIVIACAGRSIVNYLNNSNAAEEKGKYRYDLRRKLCGDGKLIKKPWEDFTMDVYRALDAIIVSFKQNLRVINKASNRYEHYDAEGKKRMVIQTKGVNWAIRKPMHKDTVFGEINLRRIKTIRLKEALECLSTLVDKDLRRKLQELLATGAKPKDIKQYFEDNKEIWQDVNLNKIEVYYFTKDTKDRFFASRSVLDDSFDCKKIMEKVADTGIQKILLRHLDENGNDEKKAFSPEGIIRMNESIVRLNDGKFHQPIYKVRVYEKAEKYAIGKKGNKVAKFVEAAKGTNLYFAIYETEEVNAKTGEVERKRSYATIPLNEVMQRLKQGLSPAPDDENGKAPIMVLSPNDLVYVPTEEEISAGRIASPLNHQRIYKMVSCTGTRSYFIECCVASSIVDKYEYTSLNKVERALTGEMIKEICIPLEVDRLGQIIKLGKL